jgi:phasin family protein
MWTADQLLAAHKANLEAAFDMASKVFEGAEKLTELNLQASKAALTEAQDKTMALWSVKDAQELMALQMGWVQPTAEKAASYSRHMYEIATTTSTDMGKATEAQFAQAQRSMMSLIDNAAKNAPAGTDNVVNFVRSAVSAANTAFDGVQKAVKQATDVADANFQAMTNTAVANVKAASSRAKRAA